ncbi:hypothetical protein FGO68_gene8695 [Halteria grandinella]|uniref:Aminotransferase class I/classII large domain-containing protein n=1 Tax=Halteria grandinella TaxID=5974 RepID=A0A8J8P334_HALGN|nr:hypothetical protein FGO68_gene8695 [Halteria grandinella]
MVDTKSPLDLVCEQTLSDIRLAGTFKTERVISSAQNPKITVIDPQTGKPKKVLNFCANNYLGLSNHPQVNQGAKSAIESHGFGMSSVRFICGTQDIHKELEAKIAEFHGMQECILYPSAFDANTGFFEAILNDQDAVISDELNHASIIDGIRLCKAKGFRYKHLDMADLEKCLNEAKSCRFIFIVTDGVFSMDGDIAPLPSIVALARKFQAYTFVDECHAAGVLGQTGRGTPEYFNLPPGSIDVISSTLGKALGGGTGGYTVGTKAIIEILRQKGRPYLFSNSIAPPDVGASLEVMRMLQPGSPSLDLLAQLRKNTTHFRTQMKAAGFTILGHHDCPIAPVFLEDARLASEFADEMMRQEDIYVIGFSFPVVPKGRARIRTQISAAHSSEQIERAVKAFVKIGIKKGVIQAAKL